jgi:hypothetical protein
MAVDVKSKVLTLVEQRVYRNDALGQWIDEAFKAEDERRAAWQTAFRIAEMYPEVADKIRGDLIDADTQEEIEWA